MRAFCTVHLSDLAWCVNAKLQGIPITDPHFWQDEEECTLDVLKQVFRSCTDEEMPLLAERLACLREAGQVLYEVCFRPLHAPFSLAFSLLEPGSDMPPRNTAATQ
jgi:hypothetical protein